MDAIRDYMNRPLYAAVAGFLIGLIIGWFVIGWGLWPVEYEGAGPVDMRLPEKVEYLRMTIEAFGANRDVASARARFNALGEEGPQAFQQIASNPANLSPELVQDFATIVIAGAAAGTPVAEAPTQAAVTPEATDSLGGILLPTQPAATEEPAAGGGFLRSLLPILCVLVLLFLAAGIVFYIMRVRPGGLTPRARPAEAGCPPAGPQADYQAAGAEPPMAQFMASYRLGDDLFDDSFSIDSPAGEFMGECGVGISETIGVGDPKKVTAFEVWLFDKNDIQTVTKVLMSAHAYTDDATRQRLAAKGEPVLVEPGTETVLETQTLQMVARVVDMGYGDGALPPESFFDRFVLELAIWSKI